MEELARQSGNAHQPGDADDEGWYSLVLALADCGEPNIIKAKVRHGVMLNMEGDLENSDDLKYVNYSLLMHVLKSAEDVRKLLLAGADPNLIPAAATDQFKQPPLQIVLKKLSLRDNKILKQHTEKQLKLAEFLILHGANSAEYPLPKVPTSGHFPISEDNASFVQRLRRTNGSPLSRHGISPTQS